ncbi:cellulase family glycosylhydrolase [Thermocatellispora tengchongensis]|nr:cellulase family glycosylhydrolase [Thermocatellispora tengchongensis]
MMRRIRALALIGPLSLLLALLVPATAHADTATFAKTSDWGTGYTAQYTIRNTGATAMSGWTVVVEMPAGTSVGTYWDALMTASGNRYTFTARDYNRTIAPGAETTFGFTVFGSGTPASCTLNGASCGGGTPDPGGPAATPVAANGQLRVCGTRLCNRNGKAIQLRGMSTHGLQWYRQCVTGGSLDALATDWKADVVRLSLYVQEGGYETDPRGFTDLMHTLIDQVSARGMYVIVDWHMLSPGDPTYNLARARTFFTEIAQRHDAKQNVIYEIANEPNGVSWATIKNYAENLIPVIRQHDPDAPILVGTRAWSSLGVSDGATEAEVIADPVDAANIMYTFHFYAASHGADYLAALSRAADRIPVFVSEFGTQNSAGEGANDFTRSQQYLDLMASKKISWVNWNFSDDFRSGAVFTTGTCAAGGPWTGTTRLKEAGAWVRERIRTPDDF